MSSYTVAWMLSIALFTVYLVSVFTICALTYRKGDTILGVVRIFFPILWLIGAILPAKEGSPHEVAETMRYQARLPL